MVLSRVQVINDALRLIAATPISDPDEDTEAARQAKACYDQTVRAELEAHAWYFAMQQAAIPAVAAAPAFRYARQFEMPTDFLRLVELEDRWVFSVVRNVDTDPRPQYELHGRRILCDFAAPLRITYVRDVVADPTVWTPLFGRIAAAALARELAMTLTKSDGIVERMERRLRDTRREARQSNAIQQPPQVVPDGSWLVNRIY